MAHIGCWALDPATDLPIPVGVPAGTERIREGQLVTGAFGSTGGRKLPFDFVPLMSAVLIP